MGSLLNICILCMLLYICIPNFCGYPYTSKILHTQVPNYVTTYRYYIYYVEIIVILIYQLFVTYLESGNFSSALSETVRLGSVSTQRPRFDTHDITRYSPVPTLDSKSRTQLIISSPYWKPRCLGSNRGQDEYFQSGKMFRQIQLRTRNYAWPHLFFELVWNVRNRS